MMLDIVLCMSRESVNPTWIAHILEEKHFEFNPLIIRGGGISSKDTQYDPNSHIARLKKLTSLHNMNIEGEKGQSLSLVTFDGFGTAVLYFKLHKNSFSDYGFRNLLDGVPGLIIGYVYNSEYVFWESEEFVERYNANKKPHDHLAKYLDPVLRREKIDITRNSGRRILVCGVWLQAAWKIIIDKEISPYIPYDKIKDFPYYYNTAEHEDGKMEFQLYKDPTLAGDDSSRLAETRYREWVGIDDIEKMKVQFEDYALDPCVELQNRRYDEKKSIVAIKYYDRSGNPTNKSNASYAVETYLVEGEGVVASNKIEL